MIAVDKTTLKKLKKVWQNFQASGEKYPEDKLIELGIAASYTVDAIVPVLGGTLIENGIKPNLSIAPFNQIHQICFGDLESFFPTHLDALVLLIRIEDVFPDVLRNAKNHDSKSLDALYSELNSLIEAIKVLHSKFDGAILVSTLPYPSLPSFDIKDISQITAGRANHLEIQRNWIEGMSKFSRVKLLDIDGLLNQYGYENCKDMRKWYLYKQPYKESFWPEISAAISRILTSRVASSKKCIVLDCDNTLWGGIVGEDGLDGISIGHDFPGSAFTDFQRVLLSLKNKGFFLAVASKNNMDDVVEVFESHDAMILQKGDISVFEVNWESKVESIQRISKKLGIGIDTLVFIDDNPKEISEVESRLPDVTCIMVPEELAYLPGIFLNTQLFDIDEVTDDDRERVYRMQAETKREVESKSLSKQDFIKSLLIKVEIFKAKPSHLARVTQLINKTNQFNLTTLRRTKEEIEHIANSDKHCILGMNVQDRFGEYGLVGVAILDKKSRDGWEISNFLLSCRVLGREVEDVFISMIDKTILQYGGKSIIGKYIPTNKNKQVKDFYKTHNFVRNNDSNNNEWAIGVGNIKCIPSYIEANLEL